MISCLGGWKFKDGGSLVGGEGIFEVLDVGVYMYFLAGGLFGALESGVWLRGGGGWTRDALVDFADEGDNIGLLEFCFYIVLYYCIWVLYY